MLTELHGFEIFDILALLNAFLGFTLNEIYFEKKFCSSFSHILILSLEF